MDTKSLVEDKPEKLYIVIPAYNEEKNIVNVVREWHRVVENIGADSKLIVVDDGSTDGTYKKLCELKKELMQLKPMTKSNAGHGSTVLYGYHYALDEGADYIFQTDSDGQTLSSEFWAFWDKRKVNAASIGYRNHREDGFFRIFVTKVLKGILYIIFGLNVTDANTPYRLMNSKVLAKYISVIPKDFFLVNVMLTVLFMYNNEKVEFIPITFQARQGGISTINVRRIIKIGIKAVKDFVHIKRKIEIM